MTRNLKALPADAMVLFSPTFTVVDVGTGAVRVIISGADKVAVRRHVHLLAEEVTGYDIPGVTGVMPANDSLSVEFDPSFIQAPILKRWIRLIDASGPGRNRY